MPVGSAHSLARIAKISDSGLVLIFLDHDHRKVTVTASEGLANPAANQNSAGDEEMRWTCSRRGEGSSTFTLQCGSYTQ